MRISVGTFQETSERTGVAFTATPPPGFQGEIISRALPNPLLFHRYKSGQISRTEFVSQYLEWLTQKDMNRLLSVITDGVCILCWDDVFDMVALCTLCGVIASTGTYIDGYDEMIKRCSD